MEKINELIKDINNIKKDNLKSFDNLESNMANLNLIQDIMLMHDAVLNEIIHTLNKIGDK